MQTLQSRVLVRSNGTEMKTPKASQGWWEWAYPFPYTTRGFGGTS